MTDEKGEQPNRPNLLDAERWQIAPPSTEFLRHLLVSSEITPDRAFAWNLLEYYENKWSTGGEVTGGIIFEALEICATHGLAMPGWLAEHITRSHGRYRIGEAYTFDEALLPDGYKHPTRSARRRSRDLLEVFSVALRLQKERKDNDQAPLTIDDAFFEAVAKQVKMSAASPSMVRGLYYEAQKLLGDFKKQSKALNDIDF